MALRNDHDIIRRVVLSSAVLLSAIAMLSANAPHAEIAGRSASVEAILAPLDTPGMPGCEVGVVQDGELTLQRAYGLADVENHVAIGPETHFDIGSMSKQFLAMEVLMLVEEGKLGLGDDVHKYVPELPSYPWKVTLEDLLHHTSGLKDYDQLLQVAGWADGDVKSRQDVLWVIERQKRLAFRPGDRYSYSDSNYFLLGLIVERTTGERLADVLEARIFRPLGMTHTSLRTERWALIDHKAWPYRIVGGRPQLFINAEEPLGDGGIFSTMGDLALWERNFDDAKIGGRRVIEAMERVRPQNDGSANDYAAGLYVRTYRGLRLIEHSGASYGYLAEKLRFPERRMSVIALCNRRDGPYVELSNRLADLYLGLKDVPVASSAAAQDSKVRLARFSGIYFSNATADALALEVRDGALFDSSSDREYRQIGPLSFEAPPGTTLCRCTTTYAFRLGPDGSVTGFDAIHPTGTGMPTTIRYVRTRPDPKPRLVDYAGEYISDDVAAAWCVEAKGETLLVRRRGFADRGLGALWKDAFDGPGGVLEFDRTKGRVTGFRLRNIRLNEVEFRRLSPGRHAVPRPWTCAA